MAQWCAPVVAAHEETRRRWMNSHCSERRMKVIAQVEAENVVADKNSNRAAMPRPFSARAPAAPCCRRRAGSALQYSVHATGRLAGSPADEFQKQVYRETACPSPAAPLFLCARPSARHAPVGSQHTVAPAAFCAVRQEGEMSNIAPEEAEGSPSVQPR